MWWYIIGLVVAFLCGGASLAYSTMAILQLNAWELGRLDRIRKAVVRECRGCSRLERMLEIIDAEKTP